MTERPRWAIILTSSDSASQSRYWSIPSFARILVILLVLAGGIGLGRTGFVVGRYALARLGLESEQKKNTDLMQIVIFLRSLTEQHDRQLNSLVRFEDRARRKYGLTTVSQDVRAAGTGGTPTVEEMVLASLSDPQVMKVDSLAQAMNSLLNRAELQNTTFSDLEEYAVRQHNQWAQRPSIWPVRGRITSAYGYRFHPFYKRRMFHDGLDIANRLWTPIRATADGVVSFVGWQSDYGNTVAIDHFGNGYRTAYAHLKQAAVERGRFVKRGDLVGYLGNTGKSTGPHLHYEVRYHGRAVNPRDYILPVNTLVD